ncbi:MAG TPA: DedA family protein [Verrucomicrobiae bacterium]|jgi:membrane protein DedA with SNARE-associated domain|nr:DedA family protein [Verrucomicrobiae bacterium]
MLKQLFQPLIAWYLGALKTGGFALVALLMALEGSFLPLPSEFIIPPAAHLAWTDGLNFFQFHFTGLSAETGVVIAAAFGSWLGASAMYWLVRKAGRPLVLKYGKFIFFPPSKLEKAGQWMSHYGAMGVLVARMLPGARQLVGIPTGITRMDYRLFSIFTVLGAVIWCSVLCYVGVKAGQDEQLMHGELRHVAVWVGGAALVFGGLYYFFVHRQMKQKK